MKLLLTTTSPYCRKVRIVAAERGIALEEHLSNPLEDPPELRSASSIGKIPVLIGEDQTVYDSRVICEYLDEMAEGERLLPGGQQELWADRTRAALGDGIMDAALAMVMEGRRPAGERSPSWVERQAQRIMGIVRAAQPGDGTLTLGDIAVACGLSYLDFRLPEMDWRVENEALASWHARVEERQSFRDCPLG